MATFALADANALTLSLLASAPKHEAIAELAPWCASIGRTTADMAAIMFVLPMPAHLVIIFEDQIRHEIAAELMAWPGLDATDRAHMENVAWVAFDRRISRHVVGARMPGRA